MWHILDLSARDPRVQGHPRCTYKSFRAQLRCQFYPQLVCCPCNWNPHFVCYKMRMKQKN